MYFVLKKMQNLRKGYRMNTQLKSTSRIIKNILTAFLIATMVYGSLPAMPAHASTFQVNSSLDTADISLDGVCDVTADDSVDVCTLRAAIMEANQVDDTDMISAAVIATSQEPKYAVLERLHLPPRPDRSSHSTGKTAASMVLISRPATSLLKGFLW